MGVINVKSSNLFSGNEPEFAPTVNDPVSGVGENLFSVPPLVVLRMNSHLWWVLLLLDSGDFILDAFRYIG